MCDILVYRVHTLLHLRTVCIQWIRHSKNFWALNEIDSHVLTSRNQPRKRASVSSPKIDTQKNRLNLVLAGGDIFHSCICIPRVHFFAACLQKNLLRKTTQLSLMAVISSIGLLWVRKRGILPSNGSLSRFYVSCLALTDFGCCIHGRVVLLLLPVLRSCISWSVLH